MLNSDYLSRHLERVAAVVQRVVDSGAFDFDVGRHGGALLVARKAGEGSRVASGRRHRGHRQDGRQ